MRLSYTIGYGEYNKRYKYVSHYAKWYLSHIALLPYYYYYPCHYSETLPCSAVIGSIIINKKIFFSYLNFNFLKYFEVK